MTVSETTSKGGTMSHTEERHDAARKRFSSLGLRPGENCCECVRPTFTCCGYCGGYGVIEEGTDGQPAGPCHCCRGFKFNRLIEENRK